MPEIKISGYNITVSENLFKYLQERFKTDDNRSDCMFLKAQKDSETFEDLRGNYEGTWNDHRKELLGIVGVSENKKRYRAFWEYSSGCRGVKMKDFEDYYNLSKHFFMMQQLEVNSLESSEKIWGVALGFFSKKITDRIFCEFCLKNSPKVKISAAEFSDYIWAPEGKMLDEMLEKVAGELNSMRFTMPESNFSDARIKGISVIFSEIIVDNGIELTICEDISKDILMQIQFKYATTKEFQEILKRDAGVSNKVLYDFCFDSTGSGHMHFKMFVRNDSYLTQIKSQNELSELKDAKNSENTVMGVSWEQYSVNTFQALFVENNGYERFDPEAVDCFLYKLYFCNLMGLLELDFGYIASFAVEMLQKCKDLYWVEDFIRAYVNNPANSRENIEEFYDEVDDDDYEIMNDNYKITKVFPDADILDKITKELLSFINYDKSIYGFTSTKVLIPCKLFGNKMHFR